mmetsp:Transcript_89322/g.158461  ORF Transcript_89322/g.158461 Transcript_89322/m.158461 type:complete len:280 (-) Transcript_89322:719-1558(-)
MRHGSVVAVGGLGQSSMCVVGILVGCLTVARRRKDFPCDGVGLLPPHKLANHLARFSLHPVSKKVCNCKSLWLSHVLLQADLEATVLQEANSQGPPVHIGIEAQQVAECFTSSLHWRFCRHFGLRGDSCLVLRASKLDLQAMMNDKNISVKRQREGAKRSHVHLQRCHVKARQPSRSLTKDHEFEARCLKDAQQAAHPLHLEHLAVEAWGALPRNCWPLLEDLAKRCCQLKAHIWQLQQRFTQSRAKDIKELLGAIYGCSRPSFTVCCRTLLYLPSQSI